MATRRDGAQKAAKVPLGDSNQRYIALQLSVIFIKIFLIRVFVSFTRILRFRCFESNELIYCLQYFRIYYNF